MEKLHNLQEFQCKPHENMWEAYMQMKKMIIMTQGVIEAQAIQLWHGTLDKKIR
jgi:benzoyl-CoA reductase/2-hydroxyglutaryl-CoA dehydratase subunit BcrC/BadD/HgdB